MPKRHPHFVGFSFNLLTSKVVQWDGCYLPQWWISTLKCSWHVISIRGGTNQDSVIGHHLKLDSWGRSVLQHWQDPRRKTFSPDKENQPLAAQHTTPDEYASLYVITSGSRPGHTKNASAFALFWHLPKQDRVTLVATWIWCGHNNRIRKVQKHRVAFTWRERERERKRARCGLAFTLNPTRRGLLWGQQISVWLLTRNYIYVPGCCQNGNNSQRTNFGLSLFHCLIQQTPQLCIDILHKLECLAALCSALLHPLRMAWVIEKCITRCKQGVGWVRGSCHRLIDNRTDNRHRRVTSRVAP